MSTEFVASPEDHFSFGLWTVGNRGRDPFGEAVRPKIEIKEMLHRLAELGVWGISYHDDDAFTFNGEDSLHRQEVDALKAGLEETGLVCSMATTNLFFHPIFKDGALTSNDPRVRRFAIQKVMRNIDVAAELGAPTYVFWGGREGVETAASKDTRDALSRYAEAIDFLAGYVKDSGYQMRFALEPKPNEPRGDIFLPTVGHALAFISTLDNADMVGLNPEVAHETMSGLSFYQGVAQAIWQGKLFHIDLNDQEFGRYDQDFRFGPANLKHAFFLVKLLEDNKYNGPRHFDAHAYRQSDAEDVKEFARGSMRTYMILREKAARWNKDPEIQGLLKVINVQDAALSKLTRKFSAENSKKLLNARLDRLELAKARLPYEKLDQLTMEVIMGIR